MPCTMWGVRAWMLVSSDRAPKFPGFFQVVLPLSQGSFFTLIVITREYGTDHEGPGHADETFSRSFLGKLALC